MRGRLVQFPHPISAQAFGGSWRLAQRDVRVKRGRRCRWSCACFPAGGPWWTTSGSPGSGGSAAPGRAGRPRGRPIPSRRPEAERPFRPSPRVPCADVLRPRLSPLTDRAAHLTPRRGAEGRARRRHAAPAAGRRPGGAEVYRLRPEAAGAPRRRRRCGPSSTPSSSRWSRRRAGRALVLASAGSGKTRTIVGKLAHLVETGTAPEAVMLVTFTRRAAQEMTTRAAAALRRRPGGRDRRDVPRGVPRLLRRHGPLVGLPSAFTVLDAEDQADLVRHGARRGARRPETRPSLPKPAIVAAGLGLAAESGRDRRGRGRSSRTRAWATASELIAPSRPGYAERKRAMGAVDYADLLVLTARLLDEHPRVRAAPGRSASAGCWWTSSTTSTRSRRGCPECRRRPRQPARGRRPRPVDLLLARRRPRGRRRFAAVPGTRVFPLHQLPLRRPRSSRWRSGRSPPATRTTSGCARSGRRSGERPVVAHLASTAGRGGVRHPADRRPHHRRPRRRARSPCSTGPTTTRSTSSSRLGPGGRRVRALLRRAVRGERARQGRARVLPAAPQPPRRARLEPRAATVRAGRPGRRRQDVGGRAAAEPDPLAAAAGLGRRAGCRPGLARFAEAVRDVARDDPPGGHRPRGRPGGLVPRPPPARLPQLARPGGRPRPPGRARRPRREPRALPRRPPARRAGRGRRGRLRARPPRRALHRPPGEGPRVAGRVRAPGRGRLVPVVVGGQRGQPRRGGAPLLRGRHPRRRRALPLPPDRGPAAVGHRRRRRRDQLRAGVPRPRPRRRWSRSGPSAERAPAPAATGTPPARGRSPRRRGPASARSPWPAAPPAASPAPTGPRPPSSGG